MVQFVNCKLDNSKKHRKRSGRPKNISDGQHLKVLSLSNRKRIQQRPGLRAVSDPSWGVSASDVGQLVKFM